MFLAISVIVWFAAFAMSVREGVWNNFITLICIFFAGMISFGSFQPITRFVDEQLDGEYTYVLDFVILWILFAVTVGLLKAICKSLSPKRVIFHENVDTWLGIWVGLSVASTMLMIVQASLHTAPLQYDMFDGRYVAGETYQEIETNYYVTPGSFWLLTVELTLGENAMGDSSFSAAHFVYSYAEHRKTFAEADGYMVRRN